MRYPMVYDSLANLPNYTKLIPMLASAIQVLDRPDFPLAPAGSFRTDIPGIDCTIVEQVPLEQEMRFTVHRETTVLEVILQGKELMALTWREHGSVATVDEQTDKGYLEGDPTAVIHAEPGNFVIFLPGEPYRDGVPAEQGTSVRKAVFLLKD
jgi:YhcH/YjgK/YiaL family protein